MKVSVCACVGLLWRLFTKVGKRERAWTLTADFCDWRHRPHSYTSSRSGTYTSILLRALLAHAVSSLVTCTCT